MSSRKLNELYTHYEIEIIKSYILNVLKDLVDLKMNYSSFFAKDEIIKLNNYIDYITRGFTHFKNTYYCIDEIGELIELSLFEQTILNNTFVIEEIYHNKVSSIWEKEIIFPYCLVHMIPYNSFEDVIDKLTNNTGYISTSLINVDKECSLNDDYRNIGIICSPNTQNFLGACETDGWLFLKKEKDCKLFGLENFDFLRVYDQETEIFAGILSKNIFTKSKTPNLVKKSTDSYNEVSLLNKKSIPNGIIIFENSFSYTDYECAVQLSNYYNVPLIKRKRVNALI